MRAPTSMPRSSARCSVTSRPGSRSSRRWTTASPVGLAVGSFASLSLDPPLVLFCAGRNSSQLAQDRASRLVLREHPRRRPGGRLPRASPARSEDKFAEIGWRHSGSGAPLIDGVLAYIDCDIELASSTPATTDSWSARCTTSRSCTRAARSSSSGAATAASRSEAGRTCRSTRSVTSTPTSTRRVRPSRRCGHRRRRRSAPSASVWPAAVLRGDDGAIRIGARTSIQDGAVIHITPVSRHRGRRRVRDRPPGPPRGLHRRRPRARRQRRHRAARAVVRTDALVGSNAVVPGAWRCRAGAMALGVPAKIREGTVEPEMIAEPMRTYVERIGVYP